MDINFICTKKRREFGKPCAFVDIGPVLLCEIDPNPAKKDEYVKLSIIDRQIDNSVKMCAHEVNTLTFPTENRGMNHREGGWPINVDNEDEESMVRFRKKIEKDKSYVNSVKSLSQLMEHPLMENTSIDIYQEYFEDEKIKPDTKWTCSVKSIFQDLNEPFRSVVDMSWGKDSTKFAAVYSRRRNQNLNTPCSDSYVWDVENNIKPFCVLETDLPITVIEFSPFDRNLILGGHISGQVSLWDIRTGGHSQQSSPIISSHTNKVTGIKWLKSKQDAEFFSGSSDGTLLFWDCRNLSAPTEHIHFDSNKDHIPNLEHDYSISCVEYDASLPEYFMMGSDQGCILSFKRECKQEKNKLLSIYNCRSGPIINVERNSFFPQLFLSCDVWSLKLWSDCVIDSSILNMISRNGYYTDAAWSPSRASTIYATKTTGFLEVWDLPGKYKEPLLNIQLDNESLLKVAVEESGSHVLCGTLSGSIQLLTIPEHLKTSSETEKELLSRCIKGSDRVIGGNMRSERISVEERELGTNEEPENPAKKNIFV